MDETAAMAVLAYGKDVFVVEKNQGKLGESLEKESLIGRLLEKKIQQEGMRYDESVGMLKVEQKKWAGGYHTRKVGILHPVRDAAEYADAIFHSEKKELYERGETILKAIIRLQDNREESATYGLWPYYLEESLDDMIHPDYNWADFISKSLLGIRIMASSKITEETRTMMDGAIYRAALCSIKRNVGLDYTNIALMSSLTILSAGELLKEEKLIQEGSDRLLRLYEYTKFNGAFSEYNSSAYIVVALHEIARMKQFFQKKEYLDLAEKFNEYAWDCLSTHYNTSLNQLTPPQARAYVNLDRGALAWMVYLGTDGAYGICPKEGDLSAVSMESLLYPSQCPQMYLSRFAEKERSLTQIYYRKNNLRKKGTDTTIIRDLDHPDITAYSYQTEEYSMGIFQSSDCWNQRRNAMIVWGKEIPSYLRLRGMIGDYDFCSAMVYGVQNKNRMFGHLGYVSDRGSFHYILDERKDGVYETDRIYFQFEMEGREGLCFEETEKGYCVRDQGLCITICIPEFMFDGHPGTVCLSEDRKKILLIGYQGEKKIIDTKQWDTTYGLFYMEVKKIGEEAAEDISFTSKVYQGIVTTKGTFGGESWKLESPVCVLPFLEASRICDEGREAVIMDRILKKMQNMENEGDVKESCPISIISMDSWEWPQGVALFAMYQYYKENEQREGLEFLEQWFDRQIQKGLPEQNVNTTCPMLTLACLYEDLKKEKWRDLLETWAQGVYERMPRAGENAIQHVVSGENNEGQIWDDTLYMTVLFLAKMGQVLGKEEYIQESIDQFLVHIKYLTDRKTGLFYHGWTFLERNHFGEALWARGNSWYTAGLVDYLEVLRKEEGVRKFLLTTLKEQVDALSSCQDESGLWHTLLDDGDSYLETSASCAFAYGILKAVRMGYLDPAYEAVGRRAVRGVMEKIRLDGTVEGVSYGTPVFKEKEQYKQVPICPMPYGQSMALMMLVEAQK